MKAFYHSSDLDGHCSGAILKWVYKDKCELIPINYGDDFPWEDITEDEIIYMLDFSLQPFNPDMMKLLERQNTIWIDHHISAIKELKKHDMEYKKGLLRDGIGACQLTWEFLFGYKNIPYGVKLLAEYDVWNHSNPDTLPFQFGMRLYETDPRKDKSLWNRIFHEDKFTIDNIIEKGKTILEYQKQENEKYAKACAFETTVDGLKCIAINKMLTNSQLFESVWDGEKYDAMLAFGFRKNKWTISLYTDKEGIDVSVTAKKFGGGGHKQAAGFQVEGHIDNFLDLEEL